MDPHNYEARIAQLEAQVIKAEERLAGHEKALMFLFESKKSQDILYPQIWKAIAESAQHRLEMDLTISRFIAKSPVFPDCESKKAILDVIARLETVADMQAASLGDIIAKMPPPPPPAS